MNLQKVKAQAQSCFFVWVGQNATIGTPHRQTGCMSMYGDFIAFSSKDQRDEYHDNFRSNGYDYCKKCTGNTGRKYKLGLSVCDYWYHIAHVMESSRP